MNLYEILVPTIRPNGRPIRKKCHQQWDEQVRRITSGLTILNPTKGQWISPSGELFVERMIPVRIMCTQKQIERIAKLTLKFYDQQAVMYYRVSDEVKIVYAGGNKSSDGGN